MNKATNYARLPKRVQAAMIDGVILLFLFVILAVQIGRLELESPILKTVLFLVPFLLYEPLLISQFGGTIGYRVMKQRVVRADTRTMLPFGHAVLRTIIKVALGWLSLIFMLGSKKNQTLHDMAANSVVLLEDGDANSSKRASSNRSK